MRNPIYKRLRWAGIAVALCFFLSCTEEEVVRVKEKGALNEQGQITATIDGITFTEKRFSLKTDYRGFRGFGGSYAQNRDSLGVFYRFNFRRQPVLDADPGFIEFSYFTNGLSTPPNEKNVALTIEAFQERGDTAFVFYGLEKRAGTADSLDLAITNYSFAPNGRGEMRLRFDFLVEDNNGVNSTGNPSEIDGTVDVVLPEEL